MKSSARESERQTAATITSVAVAIMLVVAILVITRSTSPPQEEPEKPQNASHFSLTATRVPERSSLATSQVLETNTSPESFKETRDYTTLIPSLALNLPRVATAPPPVAKRRVVVGHGDTVFVDGDIYSNCRWGDYSGGQVGLRHRSGVVGIQYDELPSEIQQLYAGQHQRYLDAQAQRLRQAKATAVQQLERAKVLKQLADNAVEKKVFSEALTSYRDAASSLTAYWEFFRRHEGDESPTNAKDYEDLVTAIKSQAKRYSKDFFEAEDRAAFEQNLAQLKTAVTKGDYEFASRFVGLGRGLPRNSQLQKNLGSWVEKAEALDQAGSAVDESRRLVAEERASIEEAQTPKYETYYTKENVTFTCTWCGGSGVTWEGAIGAPGGSARTIRCPVCGGSGQLTRRIPVEKKRELPREPVSMDRLNFLKQKLQTGEARLAAGVEEERASRNALLGVLPSAGQLTAQPLPLVHGQSVSQTGATAPSIAPEHREAETPQTHGVTAKSESTAEAERLRKRLTVVNARLVEIFATLQQSAFIPREQLMANAMNGGKAYTDRYNDKNEALKREWGTLEAEKIDLERQLAAFGDRTSQTQIAESSNRGNPRYVADDYVQMLIDGGSVKSARYLDSKVMFDGVFVFYWFDYVTKAGLRREGQYVVRLRKGSTGEWEVFNSYPAETPIP